MNRRDYYFDNGWRGRYDYSESDSGSDDGTDSDESGGEAAGAGAAGGVPAELGSAPAAVLLGAAAVASVDSLRSAGNIHISAALFIPLLQIQACLLLYHLP